VKRKKPSGERSLKGSASYWFYENAKQGAIYNDEAKRQAALRWLSEKDRSRHKREVRTLQVAWGTLIAAIAAVVIGAIGIIVTLLH
jgi:hypothetical protein